MVSLMNMMNATRQNSNDNNSTALGTISPSINNPHSFSTGPAAGNFFWPNPLMSMNGGIASNSMFIFNLNLNFI